LGAATSLVVAMTAQRLHSKVRDFGSGKSFDFGVRDVDIGCSQMGQTGTSIAESSVILNPSTATPTAVLVI
jgi:hypothetical protein